MADNDIDIDIDIDIMKVDPCCEQLIADTIVATRTRQTVISKRHYNT